MKEVQVSVPTHPIPSMQGAFAESMREASAASTPAENKSRVGNAAARRKLLLEQDISEETHAAKWRQKPGTQYHELWKLMAQISFGIYLLLNGIARDEEQVMNILQGHVDEVDEFLETTLEDFDLAQEDIDERLQLLRMPLENIHIFDGMLEDRNFRLQIVQGNEKIEHAITRTAAMMNDSLKDVQQGLNACKDFTFYLAEEQEDGVWMDTRQDMQKVFDAMKGNVDGWYKAYVSLQTKGNQLSVSLVQLGSIVAEMDRRAGEVSRNTRFSINPMRSPSPPASPPGHPSREMRRSMSKHLPEDPNPITPAIQATLPAFQMVDDRERTPELDSEQSSTSEVELAEPEPEFILAPRTYSPAPSAKPPSAPVPEAPPAIRERSSLRKRFSLKRKETPSEVTIKAPIEREDSYWSPTQRIHSVSVPAPRDRESAINTPPSRGLDSAYCSDLEKASPPAVFPLPPQRPKLQTEPQLRSSSYNTAPPRPPLGSEIRSQSYSNPRPQHEERKPPPIFTRDFIPSPRSDQQFFRPVNPVNASPNSPLQRPWTAGPSNPLHMHSNSSTSSFRGHTHTPSQLGNRRAAPSAMGMSVMTDVTVIDSNGEKKKVKKKRSAFGWLKKAFSLSEEEKAAFEERRRMAEQEARQYYEGAGVGERRWVDGKRVESRGRGRPMTQMR
ncbi:hypothetical protein V8E51_016758 [Hyaloscypha variabilis]